MNKYLIVTGANGYLGKYILLEAIQQDYHVIGFKYEHVRSIMIEHPNVEYMHCDIRKKISDQENITEKVEGKNIVGIINTAALLGSSDYKSNFDVNAAGVQNMIDFAREIKVKNFVQISSVVVLKKIKGPYGITKLKGQEILEKSDLDYTIFIPAMILGPESLGINRVLKNVFRFPFFVPMIGSGKQTQHPIFVKDFAKYIVKAVESHNTNRKVYEIGGDTVLSFHDLIRLILKIRKSNKIFIPLPVFVASMLGRFFQSTQKVPVFTAEHVKGILQDSRLNTTALQEDMDFKPTPLEEALQYSLDRIGTNWDSFINAREEITIKKEA
ncbi:MAG: NAD-dependent epimerase/dehydratase family protein [Bacteroidota bacterium]|nr:NAD-dependent epimerase/dehydratase family protein [Bacteroidota bacterium]